MMAAKVNFVIEISRIGRCPYCGDVRARGEVKLFSDGSGKFAVRCPCKFGIKLSMGVPMEQLWNGEYGVPADLQQQSVTRDGIDIKMLRKQAQVWTDLVTKEFSDFYDEFQDELER